MLSRIPSLRLLMAAEDAGSRDRVNERAKYLALLGTLLKLQVGWGHQAVGWRIGGPRTGDRLGNLGRGPGRRTSANLAKRARDGEGVLGEVWLSGNVREWRWGGLQCGRE